MNFDRRRTDGDGSGGRMTGSHRVVSTLLLAAVLSAAACGPSKQPPPVDPLKEQISVVQRQLLELQKVQLETRRKVDEQTAVNETLSAQVKALDKALEDHRNAAPPPAPVLTKPPTTGETAAKKSSKKPVKKPVKKKKKKPAAHSQ
ncbi:MAG: hypothetical protein ACYC7L_04130 [Nitrospirota bacterium]